jgi:hypothetical protein
MRKILIIALLSVFMASCGVGSYSITTGLADKSEISFVADKKLDITVTIDGQQYEVKTVKLKDYRKDRSIKKTAENTIVLNPGTYYVAVSLDGNEIYTQKIFVSAGENKVIEL